MVTLTRTLTLTLTLTPHRRWGSSIFQMNLELFMKSDYGKSYREENKVEEVTKHIMAQVPKPRSNPNPNQISNPIQVPSVTIDSILKQYATLGAAVIIRIDAEGAEYAVLHQALQKSTILCDYGDGAYLSWTP